MRYQLSVHVSENMDVLNQPWFAENLRVPEHMLGICL